jgi:hypothetical protein
MKRLVTLILFAALTVVSVNVASADVSTPRVDRREARQHARIHQGVRSGELTRGEAMRLRAGQGHVRRMERRAVSDGRVGPRERARLERAQDRQSRRIYRLKHNARVR